MNKTDRLGDRNRKKHSTKLKKIERNRTKDIRKIIVRWKKLKKDRIKLSER
jgi:hypothetical protein